MSAARLRAHGRRVPVEAAVWIGGLALMALADPDAAPLVRLCPFAHVGDWLGLHVCPGCGLGRSIGALARGDLARSFALHPLGIPAVGMLLARSAALVRDAWRGPLVPLPSLLAPDSHVAHSPVPPRTPG